MEQPVLGVRCVAQRSRSNQGTATRRGLGNRQGRTGAAPVSRLGTVASGRHMLWDSRERFRSHGAMNATRMIHAFPALQVLAFVAACAVASVHPLAAAAL